MDDPRVPESRFWMALVLQEDNKLKEAHEVVEHLFRDNNITVENKLESGRLLALIKIEMEDFNGAENVVSDMLKLRTEDISLLALHARIVRLVGEKERAQNILEKAKNLVTINTDYPAKFWLADELFAIGDFSGAADILAGIVDVSIDRPPLRMLVTCYFNAGQLRKALDLCQSIREQAGPVEYLTQIEITIYEEIGDFIRSRDLSREYLEQFPENIIVKLRLAIANYQTGDLDVVDEFLEEDIDINNLSLSGCLVLANLYFARGKFHEAIDLLYEVKRTYPEEQEAHLAYIQPFISISEEENKWLHPEMIEVNSAVKIQRPGGVEDRWIIIEDREDINQLNREFSINHPISKELIGKKPGDTIDLPQGSITIKAKILEVTSKYLLVYNEILGDHELSFPESRTIFRIPVEYSNDSSGKASDIKPVINSITDVVDARHSYTMKAEDFYLQGRMAIGTLSEILGINPINTFVSLSSNPHVGVRCCLGSFQERQEAFELMIDNPKLIVDMTSIITIAQLGIGASIARKFGDLTIAKSTLDLFEHMLSQFPFSNPGEFMQIGKDGGKYTRLMISEEIIQKEKEAYEAAWEWAKKNCEIAPVSGALNINREKRDQMIQAVGLSFADTILIASEKNLILYSDDFWFRVIVLNEHQIFGVWTQPLLLSMLDSGALEIDEYRKCVISLASLNYYHTSINAEIILEAARMANWGNNYPLTNVLAMISGERSDEKPALEVVSDFIRMLRREKLLAHQFASGIDIVLDAICTGREGRQHVLNRLRERVRAKLLLDEIGFIEFDKLLQSWVATHIL